MDITGKIREIAARLLQNGEVDLFMAWEKGDLPFQSKPFFARRVEDVERIIFDEYSIHNLSNALLKFRDRQEKIGLVVKGCDSR
ncbi:MAG: 4Fe-4S ferredoxin, partial [Syntrophomonas sp.]|nr:4Fe-4S ferredoxin [Syntrophomonas sp.]